MPITGTFAARSFFQDEQPWERFTRTLKRKGKARIAVSCILDFAGREAGRFEGEFVELDAQCREAQPKRPVM
jgi:hypothetical protein